MIGKIVRIAFTLLLFGVIAIVATSCTQLGLNYASLEVRNKPAAEPPIEPVSAAIWEAHSIPALQQAMEAHVFGPVPTGLRSRVVTRRVVDDQYRSGKGTLEEYVIEIGEAPAARRFTLAIAFPRQAESPVPLVIGQTFCDNRAVFETRDLSFPLYGLGSPCGEMEEMGALQNVFLYIFGSYITKAPMDDYLDRGIAYANFYASELVPDRAVAGRTVLDQFPVDPAGKRPTGAVSAWAAGYFAAIDVLDRDARIDPERTAVFGHSRHGKSALVAAAWDPRIEVVIAHQSGTGGASLSRRKPGETIAQITRGYPHWFDPVYATYGDRVAALPVDQHHLIALSAPRRVLLGNGRRDVWSDPNGAYRAALGANPAWQAYGAAGLTQNGLQDFDPAADLAFHIRPGGHGIVRADIDAFLAFLDTSFTSDTVDTAVAR